jgi:hypothetical protein
MAYKLSRVCGILAVAALCGCASEPTYSPPEGPSAAEACPVGEVWVCRDHYPSRLDRDYEEPMHCMCQDPQRGVW